MNARMYKCTASSDTWLRHYIVPVPSSVFRPYHVAPPVGMPNRLADHRGFGAHTIHRTRFAPSVPLSHRSLPPFGSTISVDRSTHTKKNDMPMTVQTPRIAIRDTTIDGLLDKPAKANQVSQPYCATRCVSVAYRMQPYRFFCSLVCLPADQLQKDADMHNIVCSVRLHPCVASCA